MRRRKEGNGRRGGERSRRDETDDVLLPSAPSPDVTGAGGSRRTKVML